MKYTVAEIKSAIAKALPAGRVVPRHNDKGHFYEVIDSSGKTPPIYPSVTGKLSQLKDESLINYKMNMALGYVFSHYAEFTDANIMEHIEKAKEVPQQNLTNAGDIGTEIHDTREAIFRQWIETGVKPTDFVSFIQKGVEDIRAISAIRALEKFVNDYDYTPIACELFVYSHELKVAGTLDDLGKMRHYIRGGPGKPHWNTCQHEIIEGKNGKFTCLKCDMQYKYEFTLMDIKSSNQLKDHYFLQVSTYYEMFRKLTGITPERAIIVQLLKDKAVYKIEDLKRPAKLAQYARTMIKMDEGISLIKSLRKDNQKEVISII